ncbi:MAG: ABC transporter ATP-binding protein [Deltaproteobacteria bacterium]|nr:ABC transporter ATP-binding protein [Deltaproteobacteria bacterium]
MKSSKILPALKNFAPLRGMFIEGRYAVIAGLLCLLFVDGLQLVTPLIIRDAVDSLAAGRADQDLLFAFAAWIVGLAAAMAVFRYLWRYYLLGHSRRVEREVRLRLYEHLQNLDDAWYQKTPTGDLMARMVNDLTAVRMAAGFGLVAAMDGFVLGAAAVGFMAAIDGWLTFWTLLPAPFVIIASRVYTQRMWLGYQKLQAIFGDLTERTREAFAGNRVITAYGRKGWIRERVFAASSLYASSNIRMAKNLGIFFPMMESVTNLCLAVVLLYGGMLAVWGRISPGDFVAFITYLSLLAWPMMAMGWVANLIQRGAAAMERISAVMDTRPAVRDKPGAKPISEPVRGCVEIKSLTLSHPGRTETAVSGVSLNIPAGSFAVFAGAVGSGKSTLLAALARLVEPPPGSVILDGLDVLDATLSSLRKNMGFVTQEPVIFSETIRENVVFGRDGISDETVWKALSAVKLGDEISQVEGGLDAVMGERGITLSGGQRQRLALARALAGDPAVLVLDDALSMVDVRTESAVVDALLWSRQGRTTIMATHRTSTLARADVIFVMASGKLVEEGCHRELLETGPVYASIYEKGRIAESLEGEG